MLHLGAQHTNQYTGRVQLVALICRDRAKSSALACFHELEPSLLLQPTPSHQPVERVLESLAPLGFAGALILDPAAQAAAAQAAARRTLDANETGAADTVTVLPDGLLADYGLGQAIGSMLRLSRWEARGAKVVIVGAGPAARAISRELASLGVGHLAVLSPSRPVAEHAASQLAASTEVVARSAADPIAQNLIARADLLVRLEPTMQVPDHLLGPHLAVIDFSAVALSPLRRRALNLGALTFGRYEVDAWQVAGGLSQIAGTPYRPEPLLTLLSRDA
jgi:shikimate 5-dehydrogenase